MNDQTAVINQEEAKYILETILNSQVQVSLSSVMQGVNLSPLVAGLLNKLQAIQPQVVEAKAEESATPDTLEDKNEAPEANKEAEKTESPENNG